MKAIPLLTLAAVAMPLAISIHSASAQTVIPIAGTGFSKDIFADKGGADPGAVTDYNGFARWVYMEEGAPNIPAGTQAIPSSGMITSKNATPFQLQPVDQNNVLLNGDTFTLDTPARFEDLRFLVTGIGGNGANNFQATVNFTDSSSVLFQFTCNDWQGSRDYNATDNKWAIVRDSWTGVFGNGVWTRELVYDLLPEDEAKTVASVDFVLADRLGLSAVSGTTTIPEAAILLTITPNAANPGNYDFSWDSKVGKLYDLVSETSLSTDPATWQVWMSNSDTAASGTGTTALTNVPGGGPTRFFAVVEKDPPPLLSEDFEAGAGGFTVSTTGSTAWASGAPSSSGDGGAVSAGNGGSTNCWGTDIGAPGFYADVTDTCLRSTVIDLTGVAGAELTFAEALDLEAGDTAVVNIIEETTDTIIASAIYTATDGDTTTADWNSVPAIDLAGAVGQKVRIEWCLTGVAGGTNDYMGWYIDDVVVTETTP